MATARVAAAMGADALAVREAHSSLEPRWSRDS